VIAPIGAPADDRASGDQRAIQITAVSELAPCPGPVTTRGTGGPAAHGARGNDDMSGRPDAARPAQQIDQRITRGDAGCNRAGMTGAAGSVTFPCRHPLQSDMRAFGAPNRPVTIPNCNRGAEEKQGRSDHRHSHNRFDRLTQSPAIATATTSKPAPNRPVRVRPGAPLKPLEQAEKPGNERRRAVLSAVVGGGQVANIGET
jgi:hypothetical protein